MAENFCQLAPQQPENFTHYDLSYPVLVQPKLDGVRCLIIQGVAYSRNNKPIRNKQIQLLCKQLPRWTHDVVFDGEWYAHGLNFNQIQSIVMDEDDLMTEAFHFECWDVLPLFQWQKKQSDTPYVTRFNNVGKMMARLKAADTTQELAVSQWFRRLEQNHYIGNPLILGQLYMKLLADGYEGVMIKNVNGHYKWGRCTVKENNLLKYKPVFDVDAPIVRVEQGTGKWKGCVGALIVRLPGGKEVAAGPGRGVMEDVLRLLWKRRKQLVGRTLEVYHAGVTADGSLRFPKFRALRGDK